MKFNLVASLGGLLLLVGWIGWRYFIPPLPPRRVACQSDKPAAAGQRTVRNLEVLDVSGHASAGKELAGVGIRTLAHWSVWIAFLLVGIAAASVFAMSGRISLEPLTALDLGRQEHIQSALNLERLVPPPPLPPSVFIGTERAGLETADRDWAKLEPDFARLALHVFARTEARGFPMVLLEGYRSPERQEVLADSAVHVTNARAFQSKHQYGMALDAAPMKDGRLVISERDAWAMEAYRVLGEEAEKAGLVWGGRWKLQDYGHIESPQSIAAAAKNNRLERTPAMAERR